MRRLLITVLVAAVPVAAGAQGSLSLQGFGYPLGQASTRASGTAGALGETDAVSPLNPAALPAAGRSMFAFQIDPEYRRIDITGRAVNTKTVRFPNFSIGARVGSRGFIGASFSTLLDRTWEALYSDTVSVGPDRVPSTVSTSVRGAINDARVGFGWVFGEALQAGVAFHAYTGANRMRLERYFADTLTYGSLTQFTNLSYAGTGVTAGIVARPIAHWYVAGAVRIGGEMHTRLDDSLATSGRAPNRYGLSVSYDGIPGSQLAVRVNRENWTSMRSMGTAALLVKDVTEIAAGAEIAGPKLGTNLTTVRLGARSRDLPFGLKGSAISEKTFAAGAGTTVARGWASIDVSLSRSQRQGGGLKETGTTLSVGLTLRP